MPLSMLSGSGRAYLIAVSAVLSVAVGAVAAVVPAPWSWLLAALALLMGGVSGLVSKVPAFLVGRPVVPPALALALGSVSVVLVEQAFLAPEGVARAALLAGAVLCAGAAGKPLPVPGGTSRAGPALLLLLVATLGQGCTQGPRRAGLREAVGQQALSEEPKASPFSVGPMLSVVVPFSGEPARPAELVVGTVRLNGGEGRAVNALAFGGFASSSFKELTTGGLAGGLGASVELTPGNLLYSVDLGAGLVFGQGMEGPAAAFGLTVQTKL